MRKNKLQKFAENETFACMVAIGQKEFYNKDYELKGKWNSEFFKNGNPLVLELGCGRGEYTVALSKMFPEKNFMGMDVKGHRMYTGAKIVNEEKIPNAAFIRTRIGIIRSIFDKEVSEIWVTFPDPFPKKENRRLIAPKFLNMYREILVDGGIVNLKTDDLALYEYCRELVKFNNLPVLADTSDLYGTMEPCRILEVKTTYEKRFLKEGKTIKYISFKVDRHIEGLDDEAEDKED